MGTAADNEKYKLQAAFYNNIATGFVITGYAVPYFAFMRKAAETPLPQSIKEFLLTAVTDRDWWLLGTTGLWVIFIAWLFRRMANRVLEEIED